MKKILVPIDFAGNADNTINAASGFAMRHQCGIILLHSYFDMALLRSINTVAPDDFMPVPEPDIVFLKETCEMEMKRIAAETTEKYPSLSVETMVAGMELKEIVNEVCSKNNILMIVIGATGRGKKDYFSGSTASALFEYTPVPVLAIPEGFNRIDNDRQNVLYATGFAEAAQAEVQFILDFFIGKSNYLHCCHLRFPESDNLLDEAQMDILKKPFDKEIKAKKAVFEIVDTDDAEKGLDELVDRHHIGLISFHDHNRSFFYRFLHKTVVKKDIYRFNVPLLVFRKF